MINEIRILMGDSAANYTDAQIALCLKLAITEIETYCNRKIDNDLEFIAQKIAIIKLNRLGTEGLTNQSYSGVNEGYIDGYPADVLAILNRKRKLKVV